MLADVHLDLGLWAVDAGLLVWDLWIHSFRQAVQWSWGWRTDCRRSAVPLRNRPGQEPWYGRQYLHGHLAVDFDSWYVWYLGTISRFPLQVTDD